MAIDKQVTSFYDDDDAWKQGMDRKMISTLEEIEHNVYVTDGWR